MARNSSSAQAADNHEPECFANGTYGKVCRAKFANRMLAEWKQDCTRYSVCKDVNLCASACPANVQEEEQIPLLVKYAHGHGSREAAGYALVASAIFGDPNRDEVGPKLLARNFYGFHNRAQEHDRTLYYAKTKTSDDAMILLQRLAGSCESAKILNRFDERRVIDRYFVQCLTQLKYMHKNGLAHRDFKLDNVLCDTAAGDFVVSDFGMTSKDTERIGWPMGTPGYQCPLLFMCPLDNAPADAQARFLESHSRWAEQAGGQGVPDGVALWHHYSSLLRELQKRPHTCIQVRPWCRDSECIYRTISYVSDYYALAMSLYDLMLLISMRKSEKSVELLTYLKHCFKKALKMPAHGPDIQFVRSPRIFLDGRKRTSASI